MKKLTPIAAIVLALGLLTLGCLKERDNIAPKKGNSLPPYPPGSDTLNNSGPDINPNPITLAKVFQDLSVKSKAITIDASKTNSFYGNSGARYVIKANALVKPNGDPVTGNVQVEVREYLDRGDMIFSKMLPVSNGDPLVSGGEVDIEVTQNGTLLNLRPNSPLEVFVPQKGNADPDMKVFSGQPLNGNPQNQVNWQADSPRVFVDSIQQITDTSNRIVPIFRPYGRDTLKIISDKMRKINIDRYLKSYPTETVTITITSTADSIPTSTPIFCYALFEDLNIAYPMYIDKSSAVTRTLMKLPINFTAFAIINGYFYGGVVNPSQKTGTDVKIELKKVDPAAFKKLLNDL